MAKTGQTDPLGDKKQLKSPTKLTPVICYDSIFADNCDESIEEVAEEVMEMTEDACIAEIPVDAEMPVDASQEDLSLEEEQTETIPESLKEVDLSMVLLCWFGLACTAVHAICTGNTCRCQICRMTLSRKECDLADLVTLLRRNAI